MSQLAVRSHANRAARDVAPRRGIQQHLFDVSGSEIVGNGLESRGLRSGIQVSGFGFRDSGSGFRVSGFGFQVPGFGTRHLNALFVLGEERELEVRSLLPLVRFRCEGSGPLKSTFFRFRISGSEFVRPSGFGLLDQGFFFRFRFWVGVATWSALVRTMATWSRYSSVIYTCAPVWG